MKRIIQTDIPRKIGIARAAINFGYGMNWGFPRIPIKILPEPNDGSRPILTPEDRILLESARAERPQIRRKRGGRLPPRGHLPLNWWENLISEPTKKKIDPMRVMKGSGNTYRNYANRNLAMWMRDEMAKRRKRTGGGRFKKGSPEAKAFMAKLRQMRKK